MSAGPPILIDVFFEKVKSYVSKVLFP